MTERRKTGLMQWAMVGVLLLAFALRLYRLGADSLWYDETVSVHLAGKSAAALIQHTAGDIHPPGYYLLLRSWLRLGGETDFSAAFLSAFFGVLVVSLAYRIAVRVFSRPVGLVTALLTALSPYHLWYSQEVRMYTVGAALGLVVLDAVLAMLATEPRGVAWWRAFTVYAVAGALGLWTLYYFAFLLLAVNVMVAVWWVASGRRARKGAAWLVRWFLAQAAVLILYLPWIPTVLRQVAQPPVPPWRSSTALGALMIETWSALSLGQSIDPARVWPALVLFALLFGLGLFVVTTPRRSSMRRQPRQGAPHTTGSDGPIAAPGDTGPKRWEPWFLAGYVVLPVGLIYVASLLTPLYHVRYIFTFSPPFYILVAAGLFALGRWLRPASWLALGLILLLFGMSIRAYHTDPRYASDDHREATRLLAERWRPGDAILVNAGYAYTTLLTNWDGAPIGWRGRLTGAFESTAVAGPIVVQTGSVGGDPWLGWGSPNSDFYAITQDDTEKALERLFAAFDRVWVYRVYDTVTDPDGIVRQWLGSEGTLFEEQVFAGESQLRLQGFLTGRAPPNALVSPSDASLADASVALLGSDLRDPAVEPGEWLDFVLWWKVHDAVEEDVTLFAGLFDRSGRRWAQTDEHPTGSQHPVQEWPAGGTEPTPIRIDVPPGTPPGSYELQIGWYRFEDGVPVWLPWENGERLTLGDVRVQAPGDWWQVPLAEPDYPAGVEVGRGVELLGYDALPLEGLPGESIDFELFWQAQEDSPLAGPAALRLEDDSGKVYAEVGSAPVGGSVPFVGLESGEQVRDPRSLALPAGLPTGVYSVTIGRRGPDGAWLPVRRGPILLGTHYPLMTIRVSSRSTNRMPPTPEQVTDIRFGEDIQFVGYDLHRNGKDLRLELYWHVLGPMEKQYKVFVHAVGEGGPSDIRAQTDVAPHVPTTGWMPGEYLTDSALLEMPQQVSDAGTSLLIGLYDDSSGERLAVLDPSGEVLGTALALESLASGE